eukprot:CAMPEP_0197599838 /NCGR_PEP_ID=MMETSP1326-20131121/32196_1 /TAXON_ID=1155430 /ORGANISM="Genus nov. species nov., Strain RCC2288" /LENGTH=58 /DNA_ID=CAMNT_0043166851 /DNA_START=17 /DNA_END=190 /DNA_ORIENTATION=-
MNKAKCAGIKPKFFTGFIEVAMTINVFWDQEVQYYEGQCLEDLDKKEDGEDESDVTQK